MPEDDLKSFLALFIQYQRLSGSTTALQFRWCAVVLLLALVGCSSLISHGTADRHKTFDNDAYVWQRRWNEPLKSALANSGASIRAWRVLVAEASGPGHLQRVDVDRMLLKRLAKPVIAVIRIDGRSRADQPGVDLISALVALVSDLRQGEVPLQGVEIDYDCATDRLPLYKDFVRILRARLPTGTHLSITALPTWVSSDQLPSLLAEVDETVLQVHSVMKANRGLFDRTVARQWVRQWSSLSSTPFRLALPTYWSRVTWNSNGRVVAIESEVDRFAEDQTGKELLVEPGEVSSFLAELHRQPVRNLTGISWFRLPTSADQRSWSVATWLAVMRGAPPVPHMAIVQLKTNAVGATDVYLQNQGLLDERLPSRVTLSGESCNFSDALPPYVSDRNPRLVSFSLQDADLLRAGETRLIGWVRCPGRKVEAHVSF